MVDFTGEQVPLLVQEIIMFGFYESLVKVIVIACFTIGFVAFGVFFTRLAGKYKADQLKRFPSEAEYVAPGLVGCASGMLCLCFAIGNMFEPVKIMVKTVVAPRLFILEYIKDLVQ